MDLLRFLVEHGADATAKDNGGSTPLHKLWVSEDVNLARLLVEHGPDATA